MKAPWIHNRYFRNLALLICAILLIIVLITGVAYTLFTDVVVFQSAQMGLRAADMLSQNAMRMHDEIKALFDQMLLSTQLGKILHYAECTPGELLVALKQLNAYRSGSSFIDSIYVYSAVNDNFYISSDTAPLAMQPREEMFDTGALAMQADIFAYDNAAPVVRMQEFTYPLWEQAELVTFVRYSALSRGMPTNVLFINLRQDAYFRNFDAWPDAQDDVLIYTDAAGEVLFASRPEEEWKQALTLDIPADSDRGSLRTDDNRLLCYNHSLPGGWTLIYLTRIDQAQVVENAGGAFWRIAMLGISGLGLIGLLIVFFVRFFMLIRQRTMEAQQAQEERKSMLVRHRRRILLEALSGTVGSDTNDILAENAAAALCMILPQKHEHGICQALETLLRESMGHKALFIVTDDLHRVSVCICAAAAQEDIAEFVTHCVKEAAGKLKEPLHGFLSDEFEGVAGLADAYTWCADMTPYAAIILPVVPFTREELNKREALGDLYPEEQVQRLIAYLYDLNLPGAQEALQDAFDLLTGLSLRAYRMGLMKLTLAIGEAVDILAKQYNILQHESALLLRMEKTAVVQQKALVSVMRSILTDIQDKRDARHEPMMAQIAALIQEGIPDAEFSPAMIAGEIGLSASHLSRITRKQRGYSLAEWIFEERIASAKELLEHSEHSVAEVAVLSGFYDPQYFYKAFKRRCGVTPGVYRQTH